MNDHDANQRLTAAEVKGRQAFELARDAKNLATTAFAIGSLALVIALVALLWPH